MGWPVKLAPCQTISILLNNTFERFFTAYTILRFLGEIRINAVSLMQCYVTVIEWFVRVCQEIMQELKLLDYLPYRRTNHGITVL